jgi:colanic acid/amylovoran biosynthesis glycosyltransferase
MSVSNPSETIPIAYLSSQLPCATETFVYREVLALQSRGWTVHAASLHQPATMTEPTLAELARSTTVVYESGFQTTLTSALLELIKHPLRSIGTLAKSIGDAISPGEPTPNSIRAKLPLQALVGIGLAGKLRQKSVRHLHCHFAHAPASVGMYAAMQLGIPFSFTGHANDLFQRRALLSRKLERAAFIACISRWHEQFYRLAAPHATPSYQVIRCGVDVDGWKPREGDGLIEGRPFRVLVVCRLIGKKGVDTLVRALATTSIDWELTVAGDGPDAAMLKSIAAELHCESRIKWLGMVANDAVRMLLSEADAFVLPCRNDAAGDRDGIPVALMEAMACGIPVISGDLPAIRELIEPDVNGLLIPADDEPTRVAQLAACIAKLASDHAERHRLAVAGRERVLAEFALIPNIERIEAAIRAATQ